MLLMQPCDQGNIRTFKPFYGAIIRKDRISISYEILKPETQSTSDLPLKANNLAKKVDNLRFRISPTKCEE